MHHGGRSRRSLIAAAPGASQCRPAWRAIRRAAPGGGWAVRRPQAPALLHILVLVAGPVSRVRRRRRLRPHLFEGVQREADEEAAVAESLEPRDGLAEDDRRDENQPPVAGHRQYLERHARGTLHEQKAREVDDEAREAGDAKQHRVAPHDGVGARAPHVGELRENREAHPPERDRRGVVERLHRREFEVLEKLLRDDQPHRVCRRCGNHERDSDEVEVDLAGRRERREGGEPDRDEDDAARRLLDAEEGEEDDHVRGREGLEHLDEGDGQVEVRVLPEAEREGGGGAEDDEVGDRHGLGLVDRVRLEDSHAQERGDARGAHAERRDDDGVVEPKVLHDDLVNEDGGGRGGEVERRVEEREEA
mmetsp:Transcript_40495/g.128063  ORF Transcript_40495/g.128063 Transcript_40495/m.128063 type:complete len:363 (-) Transcript_40495:489-1577(-)